MNLSLTFHSAMTARTEPDWLTIHCCSKHFLPSMRIKRAAFRKNEQSFRCNNGTIRSTTYFSSWIEVMLSDPSAASCKQTGLVCWQDMIGAI